MEVNYIDKLNHFIEEHNSFLKNKTYLQKSDYYKLVRNHGETLSQIDKNRQQISEKAYYIIKKILSDPKLTWIDKLNEQYISKKLIDEKEYLDTLFTKYKIPIILDEEQRKAIVSDEDASLIIAGAGTGKTTTMAAKVKYLVEQQHISPEEILVLSYTKKAVGELKRQIQEIFQIPAEITTFHSLGYNILSKKYQSKLIVYNEFKQQKIICKYVKEELFSNKQKMNLAISLYPECFGKKLKANFDHFKDFESYFNFYKNERYNEEVKKGIEEFIQNKKMAFMFQEHPKGLDLQTYKSKKK